MSPRYEGNVRGREDVRTVSSGIRGIIMEGERSTYGASKASFHRYALLGAAAAPNFDLA